MSNRNKLILQILREEDLSGIINTFNFPWTSLQATKEKWERYYAEQQRNVRTVCIAKIQSECVGYGSLLSISEYPNFRSNGIPEIHDVLVSEEHRGNGIGKKLIHYFSSSMMTCFILLYKESLTFLT